MSYSYAEEERVPRWTPAVWWLIVANVAIHFLQLTIVRPEDTVAWLGFHRTDLPGAWWTALTYMFVHAGLLHLAGNMYTLYLFGGRVERMMGTGKFLVFYLWCGLGGMLLFSLFDSSAPLVGASAAVFGVMLAYAMRWPDDEVHLFFVVPLKVKWLVAFLAAFNLLIGVLNPVGATTAYFAHVGGFMFAWLYLRTPPSQSIERLRQRVSQIPDIPDDATPRAVPRSAPRPRERGSESDEVVAKSKAVASRRQPAPVAAAAEVPPDAINAVLDKISAQGLGSLTQEERRVLEEASKKLRRS